MKKLFLLIFFTSKIFVYSQNKGYLKANYTESFRINNLEASFNYELISNNESSLYIGIEKPDEFFLLGGQSIDFFSKKYICSKKDLNNIIVRNNVANHEAIYIDNFIVLWKKTEEIKTIGNFICRKAIGTFRGVEYIAWYTDQIKLPFGPWKLRGLDGLILEAYDIDENFKIEVNSIEISENEKFKKNINTLFKKNKLKKNMTISEYIELLKDEDKLINEQFSSKLGRDTFIEITTEKNVFKREIFY
jgi:GLPGLI family protein